MGLRGNLKYSSLIKRFMSWVGGGGPTGGGGGGPPPGGQIAYLFYQAPNTMYLPLVTAGS